MEPKLKLEMSSLKQGDIKLKQSFHMQEKKNIKNIFRMKGEVALNT